MKCNIHIFKHLYIFVLIVSVNNCLHSQTNPLYAKHYIYEQFINPASSGRDLSPILNLSHKLYWLGTPGAPSSTGIGASTRLGSFNFYNPRKMLNRTEYTSRGRMGVGGLLLGEKDGPLASYSTTLTYAYFIPFEGRSRELSFGLSANLMYFTVNRSILDPLQSGDKELNNLGNSKLIPESGFGVYYHTYQFYIGASVNDLLKSKMPLYSKNQTGMRDYFFQTGYKFFLYRFDLEPSLFVAKIDEKPMYYFAQTKFYYQNVNWLGFAYKSTNAMLFSMGFAVRRYYVAYAIEQSLTEIGTRYGSTHELMLGVNIGLYEPEGLRKKARVK